MFHRLFGSLIPDSRAGRPVEFTQLIRDGIGLRRKLEARVARAAAPSTDPRLICEVASELHEVVRPHGR